jgi:ABC-type uncharacterized transport system auxiliary subunit
MTRPLTAAAILLAVVLSAGCVHRPVAPAPPHDVHVVTVLPPANRTGDGLLIAGTSLLERYALHTERFTVPDALAQEAASFLRARGYRVSDSATVESALHGRAPESAEDAARVASAAGVEGFVLYLEIRRWEADADTHPAFVIVGLSASLVDAASGHEVWNVRQPVHPVPTPGAVTLGAAYDIAVTTVVAEVFASW